MKLSGGGTIGPAGTGFVTVSDATVTDTDAIPLDTVISRLPGFSTGGLVIPSSTDVMPQEELLSWGGVQPPLGVTLSSAINRGLFKGEAFVTLEWNPNPWNGTFELVSYAIYRSSGNTFGRIATVSSNALTYVDPNLGLADKFAYFIKAVDADGNESPPSATVHN